MEYKDDTMLWQKYGKYVRTMSDGNYLIVQEWEKDDWHDRRTFHTISDDAAFINAHDLAMALAKAREMIGA